MQRIVHVDAYRQRRDGDVVKVAEHTRGGPSRQQEGRQASTSPPPKKPQ
jgi:hypothetical protein